MRLYQHPKVREPRYPGKPPRAVNDEERDFRGAVWVLEIKDWWGLDFWYGCRRGEEEKKRKKKNQKTNLFILSTHCHPYKWETADLSMLRVSARNVLDISQTTSGQPAGRPWSV